MLAASVIRVAPRRCFTTSATCLSGHNKWSKIKDRKGREDAKKSSVYTKANRDIVVAARTGGSTDPDLNPTLASILKRAKSDGVPKDVLERAFAKARGEKGRGSQPITYEAMAYGSVGVVIEGLTDNVNRTSGFIREILNDHDSRLANVSFLFQRRGLVRLSTPEPDNKVEQLLEEALAEAEDFDQAAERDAHGAQDIELTCPPQALAALTTLVRNSAVTSEVLASELVWAPVERGEADDELRDKVGALVADLEENEDCLRVFTTLD